MQSRISPHESAAADAAAPPSPAPASPEPVVAFELHASRTTAARADAHVFFMIGVVALFVPRRSLFSFAARTREAVLAEARDERASRHAEQLGGLRLVSAAFVERIDDALLL